jgi:hypothetical protein
MIGPKLDVSLKGQQPRLTNAGSFEASGKSSDEGMERVKIFAVKQHSMKMRLNLRLPHQPFNAAVKDGTVGSKSNRILKLPSRKLCISSNRTVSAERCLSGEVFG